MTCCVAPCRNDAQYRCPRCRAQYCSVPCYREHSQSCVQAFSQQASAHLAGLTASDTEKARFNALLNRLRRDPELQLFREDDSLCNATTLDLEERSASSDTSGSDSQQDEVPTDLPSGSKDEPHVLEELINSLNDEQRKAFFSVFHLSMERACATGGLSTDNGDHEQQKHHHGMERESATGTNQTHAHMPGKGSTRSDQPVLLESTRGPQDVADTLGELVQDMEQFDLTYDQILSRLPQQLADQFQDELKNRSCEESLKPWRPWWYVSRFSDEDNEEASELPRLPKREDLLVSPDIPKRHASSLLVNSVIDVLHAICLTLRLYDGDCLSDPFHAAKTMWTLSSVLSSDVRYATVDQVCRACVETTSKARGNEIAYLALEDVAAVLGGCSDWVCRCLFYGQTLLQQSRREVGLRKGRKTIKGGARKVAYMVSWALCERSCVFRDVARKVASFVEVEQGRCKELNVAKRAVELVKAFKEKEGGSKE
ncbi:hypothetical protein FGB62_98g049 [Gracilaria domingensis]|nr:hypothetical protein FGB62_98g049 [Gracilaria domingensis]